jgi:hypothetical protein
VQKKGSNKNDSREDISKKKTHKPRYCEKEKDKANKRILRSLSFDNNGLVKPSCGTVALYGPFGFF